jgi:hypothetical protein
VGCGAAAELGGRTVIAKEKVISVVETTVVKVGVAIETLKTVVGTVVT